MPLALDMTGILPANKITDEVHQVTDPQMGLVLIPFESAFYRRGLTIRTNAGGNGTLLKEGVHYALCYPSREMLSHWGRVVYGGIMLLSKDYTNLYFTYQAVGGIYKVQPDTLINGELNTAGGIRLSLEDILITPPIRKAELELHTGDKNLKDVKDKVDELISTIQTAGHI